MSQCNIDQVKSYFAANDSPLLRGNDTMDNLIDDFTKVVNIVMKENKENKVRHQEPILWGNQHKLKRLLKSNDIRGIWKAIGWYGVLDAKARDIPSDEEFKVHFEESLNPDALEQSEVIDVSKSWYIPILDDDISVQEVIESASSFSENLSYFKMLVSHMVRTRDAYTEFSIL